MGKHEQAAFKCVTCRSDDSRVTRPDEASGCDSYLLWVRKQLWRPLEVRDIGKCDAPLQQEQASKYLPHSLYRKVHV